MKTLKIYYDNGFGQSVDSDSPVESTLAEAQQILNLLDQDTGFLGIELQNELVLQFAGNNNAFYMEILDSAQRFTLNCNVSLTMAEQALAAAFRGEDVQESLAKLDPWLEWEKAELP